MADVESENERLRRENQEVKQRAKQQVAEIEEQLLKERNLTKSYNDTINFKQNELDTLKNRLVKIHKQLDEEIVKRDKSEIESQMLERRVIEMHDRVGAGKAPSPSPTQASRKSKKNAASEASEESLTDAMKSSTKIMRLVDSWMRTKDLQQVLLRGSALNDMSFSTVCGILAESPSLHTLDLSQNLLTMDSCSDICQLVTTAPNLTYISLEGNKFSLRAIGYFMTAVMERHNSKKLTPIDILDLQGNEGIITAISDGEAEGVPEDLLKRVSSELVAPGPVLVAQVARSLWKFLHDTGHPQVKGTSVDEVAFHVMDKSTLMKMEGALSKVLLMGEDESAKTPQKTVTADHVILLPPIEDEQPDSSPPPGRDEKTVHLPPIDQGRGPMMAKQEQAPVKDRVQISDQGDRDEAPWSSTQKPTSKVDMSRDPFADLKAAFERPKEKSMTFNLKQIVTKNGMILMNMLERLLETTSINARDVETGQTLLEYACHTGNMGLAKLCYRRGASLSQRTLSGDTPFNMATKNRRYDLMEFLHLYGVKVNSADAEGRTALHIATANNDVDGLCRLIEWGADVNLKDKKKRTPLHMSSIGGHQRVTMLLLEIGADMNAKDEKEYTAVAHAEANDHFGLMDRLVNLGGKGHGLQQKGLAGTKSMKNLGELPVSERMYKSSSLGRIGKVPVKGLWSRQEAKSMPAAASP